MSDLPPVSRAHVAGVLAIALAVRAPILLPSLPYLGYVDEGHTLHRVITLLRTGGWDPQWYLHPSLTIYLITAVVQALRPLYRLAYGHSLVLDLPGAGDFYYDFVSPPEVILAGRCVVLAASLVLVALGMALARRIAGPRAAVASGLLIALCPALVQRGAIVIVDTIAALCVLGVLTLSNRLSTSIETLGPASPQARRFAFFAGLASGAAAAAKYPSGIVFVVVALALFGPRPEWRPRTRLLLLSSAGLFLGAVGGMPAFVLRFKAVAVALLQQSQMYANPALFSAHGGGEGIFKQALDTAELGPILCAFGIAGLVSLFSRQRTRRLVWPWLAFALALLLPALAHPYQPFRYALPLVAPFLICVAAFLFPESAQSPRRLVWGGLGLVCLLASFVPGLKWTYRERAIRDTRVEVIDWLAGRARPGQRLLFVRELAFLPRELARVPGEVVVVPWKGARALAESGTFDALVFGDFDVSGALPSQDNSEMDGVDLWKSWVATLHPDARFGSRPTPVYRDFWRSDQELVLVAPLPIPSVGARSASDSLESRPSEGRSSLGPPRVGREGTLRK